jgi:dipeptidyl aminopeptidase/acylaminoacyl peptidase
MNDVGAPDSRPREPSRRRVLIAGAAGLAALAGAAAVALATQTITLPGALRRTFKDTGPDGVIPDAAQQVTLEQRYSAARGQEVGFYTAVPVGYGDGAGLPVCLVLHGASASTADFETFGLGRFLTASVEAGTPPFVLVAADGGRSFWAGDGIGDDPQRMLSDELPEWSDQLGFDTSRMAAYGWSMGGHGALLAAESTPGWLLGVAALSPAVAPDDAVFAGVDRLDGDRTGVWCGTADSLYDNAQALVAAIPGGPAVAAFSPGAHTRGYWDRVTPDAFAFLGTALATP